MAAITLNGRLEMDDLNDVLRRRGLQEHGPVQTYIDSEVLRLCDPRAPLDRGSLKNSGPQQTDIGSGQVIYNTPYARRHYYNQPLTDSLGRHYGPATFQGAPMRGSHWFERMKDEGGRETILSGAANIAGGKADS